MATLVCSWLYSNYIFFNYFRTLKTHTKKAKKKKKKIENHSNNSTKKTSQRIKCMHACTNQDDGQYERSHFPFQFPPVLLCIPVGLDSYPSGPILVGAHIQAPKCFLMRNYRLCLSQSEMEVRHTKSLHAGAERLTRFEFTCSL